MEQEPLWHDTLEGALWSAAEAVGPKKLAGELWPEKPVDEATRQLARCCDPDRAEKLSPSQITLIVKRGREANCHTPMAFLAAEADYEQPKPVEPEDERARLQREYIEATKRLAAIAERIEGKS